MGIIKRQGLQSVLITYTGMLIGFVSLLVIQPWLLSTEEIGLTRVLYSFSFLLSTIIPLSAGNITGKFFPQFRDEKQKHHGFFGFIFWLTLVGALLVLTIVFAMEELIKEQYRLESPLFAEYFILVIPLSLTIALSNVISNYLFALFKPLLPALVQEVLIRLFFIALVVVYSFGFMSLKSFILSYAATYFLQLLIVFTYLIRVGNVSIWPHKSILNGSMLKTMLYYGITILGAGVASMALKLLDAVILAKYVSIGLVGIYSVAAFIPTFIEAPINALDKVANSRISHSFQHGDMENVRKIYFQSSRFLFLLGGLLFLLVLLNVKYLFMWLPAQFIESVPVVNILSLSALFNLMTGSNSAIIFNSEKFKFGAIAIVTIAILNFILLLVLIPDYGLIGAAWATCISSFVFNFFKYIFIYYKFKLQPFDLKTIFIVLAILVGFGAGFIVPDLQGVIANVVIHTIAGACGYLIVIWYTRAASDLQDHFKFGFLKKS